MAILKGVGAAIKGFGKALRGKGKVAPTITSVKPSVTVRKKGMKASIEKAKRLLNYKPSHHFKQGLEASLAWYYKNLSHA